MPVVPTGALNRSAASSFATNNSDFCIVMCTCLNNYIKYGHSFF